MRIRDFACTCVLLWFLLLVPRISLGATLYIDPFTAEVLKGDTVTLAVRVDTDEGECINTVDAVLKYSDSVQAIDVSRGRSILSLWVEDPVLNADEKKITFAGGIPNGYCGRIQGDPSLTNIVAEIVFRAPGFSVGRPDNVAALVSFEPGTRVLLNDGYGTEAPLRTIGSTINLLQEVGTMSSDHWRDVVDRDETPPQPFGVELTREDQVFGGKYFIVFNTTDKQSGVDHYEIIEETRDDLYSFSWGRADTPWVEAQSPYVLKDQTLSSVIRVKAIDKAGNAQVTVLVPDDTLRSLPLTLVGIVAGIGALFACLAMFVGWWVLRWRRQRAIVLPKDI